METIKAVIFDLDGTLGNTIPLCIEALRQSVEPLINRHLTDKEITDTFGPTEGSVRQLAPGNVEEGTADFLRYYSALHSMCPHPFEGVDALLNTLKNKGVKLALATGKGKESAAISLHQFKIGHYFDAVETGSADGSRKTEAIPAILDAFGGIKKEEAIYVGDSPGDIKEYREVGIAIVAAAWANTAKKDKLKELQPDELFESIEDFANWLYTKI